MRKLDTFYEETVSDANNEDEQVQEESMGAQNDGIESDGGER